jgi:hypothetical protein
MAGADKRNVIGSNVSAGAHLDILLEAPYSHLECLLKNRKSAPRCYKARWIC